MTDSLLTPREINKLQIPIDRSDTAETLLNKTIEAACQAQDRKTMDAVLKWLNEPCYCHHCWGQEFNPEIHYLSEDGLPLYPHRYLCPKCRKEIGLE